MAGVNVELFTDDVKSFESGTALIRMEARLDRRALDANPDLSQQVLTAMIDALRPYAEHMRDVP